MRQSITISVYRLRAWAAFAGFPRQMRAIFALLAIQAEQGGGIVRASYKDIATAMRSNEETARHGIRWLKAHEMIMADNSTRPMEIDFTPEDTWLSGQIQPLIEELSGQIQPVSVQIQPLMDNLTGQIQPLTAPISGWIQPDNRPDPATSHQPLRGDHDHGLVGDPDHGVVLPADIREAISKIHLNRDARVTHQAIVRALEDIGFDVQIEHPVPDNGSSRRGRIDVYAIRQGRILALEADWRSAREKSAFKLRQVDATWRVIVTRDGTSSGALTGGIELIGLRVNAPRPQKPKCEPKPLDAKAEERVSILGTLRSMLGRKQYYVGVDHIHLRQIQIAQDRGLSQEAIEQALHGFISASLGSGRTVEQLDQPWLVGKALKDADELRQAEALVRSEVSAEPAGNVIDLRSLPQGRCDYCREMVRGTDLEEAFRRHCQEKHPHTTAPRLVRFS